MSLIPNSDKNLKNQSAEVIQIEDAVQHEVLEASLEEIKDKKQKFDYLEASTSDKSTIVLGKRTWKPSQKYMESQFQRIPFKVMRKTQKYNLGEIKNDQDTIVLVENESDNLTNDASMAETRSSISETFEPFLESFGAGCIYIEPFESTNRTLEPVAVDAIEPSFGTLETLENASFEVSEHIESLIGNFEPLIQTLEPLNLEEPCNIIESLQPTLSSVEVSVPCEGIVKQVTRIDHPCKTAIKTKQDCTKISNRSILQSVKKHLGRPRKLVKEVNRDDRKRSKIADCQDIETRAKLRKETVTDSSARDISGSFLDIVKSVQKKVGRPRMTNNEKNKGVSHSPVTTENKIKNQKKPIKNKRLCNASYGMRMISEQLNLENSKEDQSKVSGYFKRSKLRSEKSKKESKVLESSDKNAIKKNELIYQRQHHYPRTKNVCRSKATALRYPRATFSNLIVSNKQGTPQTFSTPNIFDQAVEEPTTSVTEQTSIQKDRIKSASARMLRPRVVKKKSYRNNPADVTKSSAKQWISIGC